MKKPILDYPIQDGYIDHWLALPIAGETLQAKPAGNETELEFRQRLLSERQASRLPFEAPPMELDQHEGLFWSVRHCRADHLLEATASTPLWQHLQRWAYAQVYLPAWVDADLELTASCTATVWLQGAAEFRAEFAQPLSIQRLGSITIPVRLKRGANHIFLQLEEVSQGPALLSGSLRLKGLPEQAQVRLFVPHADVEHRKATEAAYENVYLSQPVYRYDDTVTVKVAEGNITSVQGLIRIEDPDHGVRGETFHEIEPGATIPCLDSLQLPPGPMRAGIMPQPELFYNHKFQPQRYIPFINSPYKYAGRPEGEYEDRLILLAREIARKEGIFAEVGKMMLGWWEVVDAQEIRKAIARVQERAAGCALDLLGLVGMSLRLTGYKSFPADLLPELDAAITAFPYQPEKAFRPLIPGETERLLLAACQVLAGQKYPRVKFKDSGRTGSKERHQGEAVILALLKEAGQYGWREGHSRLDERIAALAHLADLASDVAIGELAAILLDQAAFFLAQYSFRGTFGAPQLCASASELKSGRLPATTSLNYLLFGMGNYNQRLAGSFSLSIAKEYDLPELLRSLALDAPPGAWTTERSARPDQGWEANQAAYKTADYLLASLQDYQPGAYGPQVHPWQATMGPEALVFTNHPTSYLQADERLAGAWRGNGSLPRIAQWKDALICLYNLPAGDAFGYTHAYFPTFAFDEVRLEKRWAFARVGDAYLAIYASRGLERVELGDDAGCELRAGGRQNAWLVQMGQRSTDGEFRDFCSAVLSHTPSIHGLSVRWQTLRSGFLDFGWTGPLRRDGVEVALSFPKRFEGPFVDAAFPAEIMDIGYGTQLLRLSFK